MTMRVQQVKPLPVSDGGFTLIELIVVIVILGVLAATALPKFMSLSTDARIGVVTRARVEVAGGANQAYAKCLLVSGCVVSGKGAAISGPDGQMNSMWMGYPTGRTRVADYVGIKDWVNVGGLTVVELGTSVTEFRVPTAPDPANCLVRYTEAVSLGASPTIIIVTSGC